MRTAHRLIFPVLLQPGDHPTKLSRILLACLVAAAGSSAYAAKFNRKLGHAVNTTDGQHAAAMKLAELVKQRTKGDVEITVFPANQLGNDAAMINGTRGGTIDIVSGGVSNCNGIVPNTAAMELPLMFRNAQHAYTVPDGDAGTGVLNELSPHGLKCLLLGTPPMPRWKVLSLCGAASSWQPTGHSEMLAGYHSRNPFLGADHETDRPLLLW